MDYKGDIYNIKEILAGNSNAFSYIVDRHKNKAYNLAFRICGNHEEAEELTQDSFLKAFRSLKSFKMKSSFATWLYRIVYNTTISHIRIKKKGSFHLKIFLLTRQILSVVTQLRKKQKKSTGVHWSTLPSRKSMKKKEVG